jgi:hypothetical protein
VKVPSVGKLDVLNIECDKLTWAGMCHLRTHPPQQILVPFGQLVGIGAHGANFYAFAPRLASNVVKESRQRGELLIPLIVKVGRMEPQTKNAAGALGASEARGNEGNSNPSVASRDWPRAA